MIPASVMAIQITKSVLKTNVVRSNFNPTVLSFHKIVMAHFLTLLIPCENKAVNVLVTGYVIVKEQRRKLPPSPLTLQHFGKYTDFF